MRVAFGAARRKAPPDIEGIELIGSGTCTCRKAPPDIEGIETLEVGYLITWSPRRKAPPDIEGIETVE